MESRQARLRHLGTKGSFGADYDWRATVDGQTGTLFTAGSWVVDDPDGLLAYERHGDQTNLTVGISALMHAVDTVTINTFIPQNNIDDPWNMNPFGTDHIFGGDDRINGTPPRATWNKDGAYRTHQRFNVIAFRDAGDHDGLQDNAYANETDGLINDSWFNNVGVTHRYHKSSSLDDSGNLTTMAMTDSVLGDSHLKVAEAKASNSNMLIEPSWLGDRKIRIQCIVSVGNPLAPGILGNEIDYDFEITIDYTNSIYPLYSLVGRHDGFPAYEVYIGSKLIYEHDPLVTGEDIGSLFDPLEHDVEYHNLHIN